MAQCKTQEGNIKNNQKVKLYFALSQFSTINIVVLNHHVYKSAKIRYNVILGKYILLSLLLYLKYNKIIEVSGRPFKSCTATMVEVQ